MGPDVEFSENFKAAIINIVKELMENMDSIADLRWQENQWTWKD